MQLSEQQEREQLLALLPSVDWDNPTWQEIDSLIQDEAYRRKTVARCGLPKDSTYGEILAALNEEAMAERYRAANLPADTDLAVLEAHEAEESRKDTAAEFGLDQSADWRTIALTRWDRLNNGQPVRPASEDKQAYLRKFGFRCLLTFVISLYSLLCLRLYFYGT